MESSSRIQWGMGANTVQMSGVETLHEDDDIIVIEKEAGLLRLRSDKERIVTAYRQLMSMFAVQILNRIYVVHNIGPVCEKHPGVMMFGESKNVQQILQNSWQESGKNRTSTLRL